MTKEEKILTGVFGALGIGSASYVIGRSNGYKASDKWHRENTPEAQLKALEQAKVEKENAAAMARQERSRSEAAYERLRATKQAYQDEIRPEIESKVRQELQDYISNADVKYTAAEKTLKEAKRENELTQLRLELMKEYKKDGNISPTYTPFVFSSSGSTYSDAVTAIANSDMDDYRKQDAIGDVEEDRDSEYYRAIIGIVQSDMDDYRRCEAIENL